MGLLQRQGQCCPMERSMKMATLFLHQPGQLWLPCRPRWPLRLKMWLVSVGNGIFHFVSLLFTSEMEGSHGAVAIARDRPAVRAGETNGSSTSSFPFLSLLTSAVWAWGGFCLQPGPDRAYLEGQRVCGGALREPNRQQLGSRLLRRHNDKSLCPRPGPSSLPGSRTTPFPVSPSNS